MLLHLAWSPEILFLGGTELYTLRFCRCAERGRISPTNSAYAQLADVCFHSTSVWPDLAAVSASNDLSLARAQERLDLSTPLLPLCGRPELSSAGYAPGRVIYIYMLHEGVIYIYMYIYVYIYIYTERHTSSCKESNLCIQFIVRLDYRVHAMHLRILYTQADKLFQISTLINI